MNYEMILNKKIKYEQNKSKIDSVTLSSCEKDFELRFTHNSTAIEGNTLGKSELNTHCPTPDIFHNLSACRI